MSNLWAVILAGGSGTRFWPASRNAVPKQLLPIGPTADRSLIAATVRRLEPLCPANRVIVATGAHLVEATRRALPALASTAFLGEPVARNTAACIGWATLVVRRWDPEAIVMVLPSDHHVGDESAFRLVLAQAAASAETGTITTVGITPSRPETGYGYIEVGAEVGGGVHRVVRFVEKPTRAVAEQYVQSGRYVWNSGMFFFRAATLLEAIAEHMPELWAGLERIERAAESEPEREQAIIGEVFAGLPSVSIDYGLMEKATTLNVVPASFGWSDVGSWESAWELGARDADGNVADPNALLLDCQGSLLRDLRTDVRRRVVAAVGIQDLCIIETDDALLIIPRERAQDVRLVVEALKRRGDLDRI
jgi:mannose-1-phosphate guanylyltransferase